MYAILYYVLNIQTGISLGTVYIFLYYIKQCFSPLKEMFEQIEEIQNAQVSLERIDTILKIKEKIPSRYIGIALSKNHLPNFSTKKLIEIIKHSQLSSK